MTTSRVLRGQLADWPLFAGVALSPDRSRVVSVEVTNGPLAEVTGPVTRALRATWPELSGLTLLVCGPPIDPGRRSAAARAERAGLWNDPRIADLDLPPGERTTRRAVHGDGRLRVLGAIAIDTEGLSAALEITRRWAALCVQGDPERLLARLAGSVERGPDRLTGTDLFRALGGGELGTFAVALRGHGLFGEPTTGVDVVGDGGRLDALADALDRIVGRGPAQSGPRATGARGGRDR